LQLRIDLLQKLKPLADQIGARDRAGDVGLGSSQALDVARSNGVVGGMDEDDGDRRCCLLRSAHALVLEGDDQVLSFQVAEFAELSPEEC
jgi:hypothetical protein